MSTSWWDTLYSPHPPIAKRIGRVATMGDGVPAAEFEAAERIGREYDERLYVKESRKQLAAELQLIEQALRPADEAGTPLIAQLADNEAMPRACFRLTHARTPLYERPDGWSRVIDLPEGSLVTVEGREGQFLRVATSRGSGYIAQATPAVRIEEGH